MKGFLLTHASFVPSFVLLRKLLARYQVPTPGSRLYKKEWDEARVVIKLRVCHVLKYWMESKFSDFSKEMIEAYGVPIPLC
jgi:hypothetical protein